MPRVLIEMGFISNTTEGAKLDSDEGQDEIAQSIANAIISYKKEYFGSGDGDVIVKPSQKAEPVKTTIIDTVSKPKTVVKIPEIKKTEPKKEINPEGIGEVIFKVQLSASSKKLDLTPSNFKGLQKISMSGDVNLYRYMYGETSNYEDAKQLLQEAKSKGYASAFLIAFKNGKKIDVKEALKQ